MTSHSPSNTIVPIREALPQEQVASSVKKILTDGTTREIFSVGKYRVFTFIRHEAPALFHELARLREITFRLSGQGSGTDFDETPEDETYTQLILWDTEAARIAGAYRIGFTAEILTTAGTDGLYLSHMFDFSKEFFDEIGSATELSRSFVTPDYQGDRLALALLWRGVGNTLTRIGGKTLYGSVTINALYSERSRSILVAWLKTHKTRSGEPLVRAQVPFTPNQEHLAGINFEHHSETIDSLRDYVTDPQGQIIPIPPLVRHYISLGARFHDFHLEASCGNAIYCLNTVAPENMPPTHTKRFV